MTSLKYMNQISETDIVFGDFTRFNRIFLSMQMKGCVRLRSLGIDSAMGCLQKSSRYWNFRTTGCHIKNLGDPNTIILVE